MQSKHSALRSFLKLFLFLGLAGMCLLTAIGYLSLTMLTRAEAQARYEKQTRQLTTRIGERMESQASILYRARAFVLVNRNPTEAEWVTFMENQEIFQDKSGVDAVSLARYSAGKKGAIEQQLSREHQHAVKITPEGERSEYLPLVLSATATPQTPKAYGFDLLSEPVRSTTITEARNSGKPTLSAPITLVPSGKRAVIMILPIYVEDGSLYGFVSAAYYTNSFTEGILDADGNTQLQTQILDASSKEEVYKSPREVKGATTTRSDTLALNSREWSITYSAPSQTYGDGHLIPYVVLGIGIVFIVGSLIAARTMLRLTDPAKIPVIKP